MTRTYPAPTPSLLPCPVCGHDDAAVSGAGPMEQFICEAVGCRHQGPLAPVSYDRDGASGYLAAMVWNAAAERAASEHARFSAYCRQRAAGVTTNTNETEAA